MPGDNKTVCGHYIDTVNVCGRNGANLHKFFMVDTETAKHIFGRKFNDRKPITGQLFHDR